MRHRHSSHKFSLSQAADYLGISRQALITQMQERGHFLSMPLRPAPELVSQNLAFVELRHTLIGDRSKPYQAVIISIQGLAWIERQLFEITPEAA